MIIFIVDHFLNVLISWKMSISGLESQDGVLKCLVSSATLRYSIYCQKGGNIHKSEAGLKNLDLFS